MRRLPMSVYPVYPKPFNNERFRDQKADISHCNLHVGQAGCASNGFMAHRHSVATSPSSVLRMRTNAKSSEAYRSMTLPGSHSATSSAASCSNDQGWASVNRRLPSA